MISEIITSHALTDELRYSNKKVCEWLAMKVMNSFEVVESKSKLLSSSRCHLMLKSVASVTKESVLFAVKCLRKMSFTFGPSLQNMFKGMTAKMNGEPYWHDAFGMSFLFNFCELVGVEWCWWLRENFGQNYYTKAYLSTTWSTVLLSVWPCWNRLDEQCK